ncbi:MAG: hypothetical protein ACOH10_14285, partial [Rhodoglobus sp.]
STRRITPNRYTTPQDLTPVARGRRLLNGERPARAPMRRMGEIPVLARLVWDDGTQEWMPAMAVRWTPTHVMVTWRDEVRAPRTERFEWLQSQDVVRTLTWLPDTELTQPAGAGSL